MKRFAIVMMIMLLAVVLAACAGNKTADDASAPAETSQSEAETAEVTETDTEAETTAVPADMLTLDLVKELAQKGHELSWADFNAYAHNDISSGLYAYQYDIDDNFELLIGGSNLDSEPLYILLSCKENGNQVDIRDADVNEFIIKNTAQ